MTGHAALVLLAALMFGTIVGALTILTPAGPAAAVLAVLATAGASAPVLHKLIGP
ncbi:hypothetical protein Sgou_62280 [Streptomyces gougerotii]|uniref:Uncharacterized protein n=1 Tax=Streptomyces gougerotii TaxID=53448 RepID=A0ABQ1DGA4_9ACTN|nr:hypothetical protein Sgou_62280 [Streptomyces gougerotii]